MRPRNTAASYRFIIPRKSAVSLARRHPRVTAMTLAAGNHAIILSSEHGERKREAVTRRECSEKNRETEIEDINSEGQGQGKGRRERGKKPEENAGVVILSDPFSPLFSSRPLNPLAPTSSLPSSSSSSCSYRNLPRLLLVLLIVFFFYFFFFFLISSYPASLSRTILQRKTSPPCLFPFSHGLHRREVLAATFLARPFGALSDA